jgi:predicted nuclease with TOPRIM domain
MESITLPIWVFWLLIIVIVILIIFILIRDKGVRNGVKKLFSSITKKIKRARIKGKIDKEKEKKAVLIRKLGESIWEKEIDVSNLDKVKDGLKKLKDEESKVLNEIENLNSKIEKYKEDFGNFKKDQEIKIKENEEEKKPFDM